MKIQCKFCKGKCIKKGFQFNGNQRYKCCACQKRQQIDYRYNAYKMSINQDIVLFTKEGLGIRSTARLLKISPTTLLKRIISIARNISKPIISRGKDYEVDELCTYIRHKRNFIWLVYALEKNSRTVVSFNVGIRTNNGLSRQITNPRSGENFPKLKRYLQTH